MWISIILSFLKGQRSPVDISPIFLISRENSRGCKVVTTESPPTNPRYSKHQTYMKPLDYQINKMNLLWAILASIVTITTAVTDPIEGRYSFSLTTFHPSGKLPQLSHATKASTLGPPIIAFHDKNFIALASLQSLPSPLIHDDGTARFVKITDSIVMGHTGVNADGRVVTEAAQRLAVEHAYTFQEEIPMSVLLEEMALLFQEYTMKAGVRPFGCCLIVAGLEDGIYRIDPAGTVTKLDKIAFAGRGDGDIVIQRVMEIIELDESTRAEKKSTSLENIEGVLADVLREGVEGSKDTCLSVICASVSTGRGSTSTQNMRRVTIERNTNQTK